MQCAQVNKPSFAHQLCHDSKIHTHWTLREKEKSIPTNETKGYQLPTPTKKQDRAIPGSIFFPHFQQISLQHFDNDVTLADRALPKKAQSVQKQVTKSVVSFLPEMYKKIRPGIPNKQRPWQLCLLTTRQEQRRGIHKLHFSAPSKCQRLHV